MMVPDIRRLTEALNASFRQETSSVPGDWTVDNPARGHCVPASLVVQDYLGGDLGRYRVTVNGSRDMHYFNVLDDGTVVDTTLRQYGGRGEYDVCPIDLKGFKSVRDKRLSDPATRELYLLLKQRVAASLGDR